MEQAITEAVTKALPLLLRFPDLSCDYDEEADVLYITFEPVSATDSDLTDDDILLSYSGDRLVGVTVLHASRRIPSLAAK